MYITDDEIGRLWLEEREEYLERYPDTPMTAMLNADDADMRNMN